MITIYFETHATTIDNEKNLASGHNDVELSELGEQQSKDMGKRYKDKHIDVIFASDMQRAYKTAEIAFEGRHIEIIKDPRLRECDYGDMTQQNKDEVNTERVQHITIPFPNGESYEQTSNRMKNFLEDLLKYYDGKTVLLLGHRATQYGLEHWILKKPLEKVIPAPWKWQPGWTYELKEI